MQLDQFAVAKKNVLGKKTIIAAGFREIKFR